MYFQPVWSTWENVKHTGCGLARGQLGPSLRPSWTSHQLQTGFVSACFSQPRFSPLWGEHHNAVDSDFLWGLKRSAAHCRLNKRHQTKGADQSAHILRKCLTAPQVFDGNSCVWGSSGSFPRRVELRDLVGFVCRNPLLSSVSTWAQPGPCGVLRYSRFLSVTQQTSDSAHCGDGERGKTQNTKQIIGGSTGLDWHPAPSTCYFTLVLLRRLSAPLRQTQGLKDGPLLGGGCPQPAFASPACFP